MTLVRTEAGSAAESIVTHVSARRAALVKQDGLSAKPWGLALSGGGIRSATFCFGLLKALASNELFRRFDILSTVSGGGYIGSAVGRLFQEADSSAERVEKALADADTRPFGVWLRANGRYLIPRGARDLIFAAANFGRNIVGVHVELAFLSLLLGSLLVGLDLVVWEWANCVFQSGKCWRPGWVDIDVLALLSGPPPIWLFLPLLAWVGAVLACAYWALPARNGKAWVQPLLTAAAAIVGIVLLVRHSTSWLPQVPRFTGALELPGELVVAAVGVLLAWIAGIAVAAWMTLSGKEQDRIRNRLTASLSVTLRVGLIVAGLGVADYLAWSIGNLDAARQGTFGAALALTAVALRAALPKIADLPKSLTPGTRRSVLWLINVAGLLILAMAVIFWMSWVHRATSEVLFVKWPPELRFKPSYEALLWLAVPPALLILISLRNREFLNRSSLYTFYRARLIRSYLGAGNPSRFGVFGGGGTCITKGRVEMPKVHVADVHAMDDVPMEKYEPHKRGGPIHLLNVCVNQTRDPKGGLFNQDRKGLLLTVGPNGQMCTTPNVWRFPQDQARLTLGSWMAISGAAVAPGLGSSTRSGVAAVLMLAGIRLGYWWDSLNFGTPPGEAPMRPVTKYEQFFSELRGRFDGDQGRDWFLSDGGHFENTAAFALLREECEVIVIADCGADPRYAFGDLENLVRKARIDLQADIAFLRPKSLKEVAAPSDPLAIDFGPSVALFGSLNELASADSQACLALARVNYRHSGQVGHIVIVKPNMCHGVPVDLVNFKADNPLFPQEPTTDQFFSEAQWESYFQLGRTLGANVGEQVLCNLAIFASQHFVDDDGAILVTDTKGEKSVQYSSKRLSSRIAATGAVSASVSLGAVTTIGLASWDAVNKELGSMSLASRIEPGTYKELTDIFGKLSPVAPGASAPDSRLGEMATALLRVGDAVCNPKNLAAFRQSELMSLMVARTKQACRESTTAHASCSALINDDKVSTCLQDTPRVACVPTYWTRDYKTDATKPTNCWDPSSLPVLQSAELASTTMPAASAASGVGSSASDATTGQTPIPTKQEGPVCAGKTVYLQVYGPELRDEVRLLREPWRALGASVPPVEDVWDSARRAGRRLPQPYQVPTVIYQHEASKACAQALEPKGALPAWQVRALQAGMSGRLDVIEVWVPPVGQSAGQAAPANAFCYQEDDRTPGPQRYSVHCHVTQVACESARGDNKKKVQTACLPTSLNPGATAFSRGWAGSWYARGASSFGAPFPSLPDSQ